MRGVAQGVVAGLALAGGIWLAQELQDPTSWLRLRLAELGDLFVEEEVY